MGETIERAGVLRIKDFPNGLDANYTFIGHDILVVRDCLPFAEDLIQLSEKLGVWQDSVVFEHGVDKTHVDKGGRNNLKCDVNGDIHPDFAPYKLLLEKVAHGCARLYVAENKYIRLRTDEGYQLLRYDVNQHYRAHIDAIMGRVTEFPRALSFVGYLNDNFEGGELHFTRQDITIKPQAGMAVLFPSYFTHVHESTDVTEGVKFSAVTWFS